MARIAVPVADVDAPVPFRVVELQPAELPAPEGLPASSDDDAFNLTDHYAAIAASASELKDAAATRRRLEGELAAAARREQELLDELRDVVTEHTEGR